MLNFQNKGREIAQIKNKNTDNIVSVNPNFTTAKKNYEGQEEINLTGRQVFQQSPQKDSEITYICGARGSGKSRYAKNYVKEYIKKNPQNKVYLFSQKREDTELDSIQKLKRVEIDDSIHEEPFNYEDFKNSLVIFDDVDKIPDKQQKQALKQLQDEIIHLGRSLNVSLIMTNHDLTEGRATKSILGSCDSIIFFPQSGAKMHMQYLCEKYGNISKKDLEIIRKSNTRWCCILRTYPNMIMTEKKIFIPS